MSIEREELGYVVCCTKCGESVEPQAFFFNDAIAEIKDLGWKVFKDRWGTWNHVCNKCTEGLKC